MKIQNIIEMIPEESQDEVLRSIQTITTFPAENRARVRCWLSNEFRLFLGVSGNSISITAEQWPVVTCQASGFIPALRRFIYDMDEAVSSGRYQQTKPKPNIIHMPNPPKNMDIPVWDEKAGQWYDAEY